MRSQLPGARGGHVWGLVSPPSSPGAGGCAGLSRGESAHRQRAQLSLPLGGRQGTPGPVRCSPHTENGFDTFKGLKRERICNADPPWPTNSKSFTAWSFAEEAG